MNKTEIRKLLRKLEVSPSKRLGQSFLVDDHFNHAIVEALGVDSGEIVLEIGPGFGNLTELLLERSALVLAVEVDTRFCEYLAEKFNEYKNFHLLCKDILEVDFEGLRREYAPNDRKLKIVGNIPYRLSSPIMKHIMLHKGSFGEAYLLLQKEVWERITGRPGSKDYGFLTVLVSLHFSVEKMFDISRESFFPVPKVDSAFVRFVPTMNYDCDDPDLLLRILSRAFSERRKMLRNTLSSIPGLNIGVSHISEILDAHGIPTSARPEELIPEQFLLLTDEISKITSASAAFSKVKYEGS